MLIGLQPIATTPSAKPASVAEKMAEKARLLTEVVVGAANSLLGAIKQ
jgi:hypothetical protein